MDELYENIQIGAFDIPERAGLSENCIDLLNKMICLEPTLRISAEDCLKHPFIVETKNK